MNNPYFLQPGGGFETRLGGGKLRFAGSDVNPEMLKGLNTCGRGLKAFILLSA